MKFLFTFDPQKGASNKDKHGIDFPTAQALWRGRVIESAAKFEHGEMR